MDYTSFLAHRPVVKSFFDPHTNTVSHVVADPHTMKCAIIDSVYDYEPHSATLRTEHADALIAYIQKEGYTTEWILETHVHADHITAAQYLKEKLGGTVAIGDAIIEVQKVFGEAFDEDESFTRDGSQFDMLFKPGHTFTVGSIPALAIAVPGHTPADMAYLIGDALFVGDTLFMPDYGSARCDFPGGDAETLHTSADKIFSLPDSVRMFLCHDYLPEGRTDYVWETTIGAQKTENIHLNTGVPRESFTAMRTARDSTLAMPKLIIPSIQINMRAGHIPKNAHGKMFLKIPVNGIFSQK